MAQHRQALGKGIGALIPSAAARRPGAPAPARPAVPESDLVQRLPLDAIDLNPRQPRVHFDEEDLRELSASIAERGVLQPILVRRLESGRYELVAGERRLRASRAAGLDEIPALVKQMNDDESLLVAIIENVQRADLNALEEAQGYQVLLVEFELTQDEVARRVGKSRPAIANALRLLQLPDHVQAELRSGRLTAGHARALLGVSDPAERDALARRIVDRGLSVRDAEKAVREGRSERPERPATTPRQDPDVAVMESDLSRLFGTKVTIASGRSGDGRGRVELNFYSHDDLARLIDLLRSAALGPRGRSAGA